MRSLWKGSITFGLVTIPVKLYAATEDRDVRFHLLHEPCRTPVQYRKWCPACDREVSGEEIVKGFEYEKGRYVVVSPEELERIPVAAAHTVEIVDFVRLEQIDPIYFDRTYYLEPGEGGARAYALLRRAMEETGRIAIARVVIRTRESLAAIRVFQGRVLVLETMHFPEEIRSPAGLTGLVEPELNPREVEMAVDLVSRLSADFTPEKYENRYRAQVLSLIEAKVAGEDVAPVAEAPVRTEVVDLMTALRASIEEAQKARQEEGTGGARPAAAPRLPDGARAPGPPGRARPQAPPPGPGVPRPGAAAPGAPKTAATGPGGSRPAETPAAPTLPDQSSSPGAPGVTPEGG
ncbi:MAG TPA: Ku protein [Symbiobacteriaceae bacterium]